MMLMAMPTKAAIGFARGKGLDVADLVVEDGYIYAELKRQAYLQRYCYRYVTSIDYRS